jgi:competence protein ComEC
VGTRSDPNNNSLVLRATVGSVSLLLTGDAENPAQLGLLGSGARLRSDVLKVPHHGSAYSESAFLDAVDPAVALIEVGAGNDYGHPNPGVVAHLRRGGARVLRTDEDGDLAVLVDRGRLAVATRGPDTGRSGT